MSRCVSLKQWHEAFSVIYFFVFIFIIINNDLFSYLFICGNPFTGTRVGDPIANINVNFYLALTIPFKLINGPGKEPLLEILQRD